MTSIFLDSDIIIDLLAKRENYLDAAALFSIIRNKEILAYTTPLVLANVDYIVTKFSNRQKSKKAIRILTMYLSILPMDENTVYRAIESPLSDFEDALHYYAAESQGVDFIVTRNEKDYRKGNIKVVSAKECLNLHNAKNDM